jgi:5'-nucleotidase
MKSLKKNLLLLLVMGLLAIISGCNDNNDEADNVSTLTLTIMHINDSHSYAEGVSEEKLFIGGTDTYFGMGGYARLMTKVASIRSETENSLLLHAGDAVQGTLYFTEYEGKADFEFLNAMDVDAMCVGNHEFDKGPEYLANFIDYADFPIISANIDASAEDRLAGLVNPYVIKEYDGEKVGIIGLTTPSTEYTSSPGDHVVFNELDRTVSRYVTDLEDQGINKIILLTHLGYKEDMALAGSVEGVDIIVGGHSHTLLGGEDLETLGKSPEGDYPTEVENNVGRTTYVVQAWEHTLAMGKLDVEFDEDGMITSISGTPILLVGEESIQQKDDVGNKREVDETTRNVIVATVNANNAVEFVAEDAAALNMLETCKDGIAKMESEVIANVPSDLYHTWIPFTDKYGEGILFSCGSQIAPLVCDSMLWKMQDVGLDTDFALQNAGGIRKTIHKGDLTVGDVYELMPFGNTLVVLELTGSDFKAVIQGGVNAAISGSSNGAYPYVGGCRYTVDAQTDPEAPVVISVEKQDDSGNWIAISNDKYYRIVTNRYIADGGDN